MRLNVQIRASPTFTVRVVYLIFEKNKMHNNVQA